MKNWDIKTLIIVVSACFAAYFALTPIWAHKELCTVVQGVKKDVAVDRTVRKLRNLEKEYGCIGYECRPPVMPYGVWQNYQLLMEEYKKETGWDYVKAP